MDCGVDNEDEVVNDDVGDKCSTTNSKVDTGCAENSQNKLNTSFNVRNGQNGENIFK